MCEEKRYKRRRRKRQGKSSGEEKKRHFEGREREKSGKVSEIMKYKKKKKGRKTF